jgi:hypothetical protein
MITNTGKSILSKYLIGQSPAYASHIAIGCGATPKNIGVAFDDYYTKQDLDFEMIRAPIVSRGYVVEDGVSKIVLTAELPTQERYEITEVGLYSAGSNQYAVGFDSRVLYYFSRQEPWRLGELPLQVLDNPLDEKNNNNNIDQFEDEDELVPRALVFQTNATNKLFANASRQDRNEQSRFLNNMVLFRGDFSGIDGVSGEFANDASYVSLSPISVNLDRNAPTDKIKIALSVVNRDGNLIDEEPDQPSKLQTMVEFVTASGETAKFKSSITSVLLGGDADFETNRYYVLESELKDLEKSAGFAWSQVNSLRVYSAAFESDGIGGFVQSEKFYIAMDAVRLDNINSYNPIYGLTGYTVIKSLDARPIIKLPNTTSLIEFRLAIGVQ